MAHDVLRFLIVYFRERVVRLTICVQELVEFRLQRLRIAVLRALYQQGHEPDGESGNAIPIERSRVKDEPEHRIKDDDAVGPRVRGQFTESGQRVPDRVLSGRADCQLETDTKIEGVTMKAIIVTPPMALVVDMETGGANAPAASLMN